MNERLPKINLHPKFLETPPDGPLVAILVPLVNLRNEAHTHRLGHCGSQLRVAAAVDATAPVAASAVTAASHATTAVAAASHATTAFPAASKATTADATTAVVTS